MYLRSYVAALVITVAASGAIAQTAFRNTFRTPICSDLRRIVYADTLAMIAIGDAGTFIATNDGGKTFAIATVGTSYEDLHVADFIDNRHGAVGGDHGLVAFTLDGGVTWTVNNIPEDTVVTAVCFNAATGAASAGTLNGHFYSSANSGATWQLQKSLKPASDTTRRLYSVMCGAHVAGRFIFFDNSGILWRSTTGGATWDSVSKTAFTGASDICFADANHGWVVERGYIEGTTDGGVTWPGLLTSFLPDVLADAPSMHFVNDTTGWVLQTRANGGGWQTLVIGTKNGARNFSTSVSSGFAGAPMLGVRFDVGGNVGWLVGRGGEIRRTTNGGTSWTTKSGGNGGKTNSLSVSDGANIFVATTTGAAGYNFRSTNGGTTWTPGASLGENPYHCLYATSDSTVVCLLDAAHALYSTDSGRSYKNSGISSANGNLNFGNHIFALNSSTLFACGEGGLVMKSVNGGRTWTDISVANATGSIGGVYFRSATAGIACGDKATLFATANGGAAWNQVPVTFEGAFTDVAFNSATEGWIATDSDGTVLHSQDGGITWSPKSIGAFDTLRRVIFPTATLGFVGGTHGQVYVTFDGGATWRRLQTGTSVDINDMCVTPRTNPKTLWICGGYGNVLKWDINANAVETGVVGAPSGLLLDAPFPNPMQSGDASAIRFALPFSGTARLDIVSVLGQTVRTLQAGMLAAGEYAYTWDGRLANGMNAPAGTYFAVLHAGTSQAVRPIAVTR